MKTKLFTALIAFFIISSVFAQTNLNSYKYIIVPNKFDFLNEENQYRLNELTQFLFDKYGFTALMEGSAYPEDLGLNRCLALRSNVTKDSGMFKTKLQVVLKDCNDKTVFTSDVGESREKEFDVAYNKALRGAFTSFETLNYSYTAEPSKLAQSNSSPVVKAEVLEEVKKLKEELKTLKEQKETTVIKEATTQVVKTPKVEAKEVKQKVASVKSKLSTENLGVLYAQEITNGFQLVDSSPKVVYRIKSTNLKQVFLVEDSNAIIYKNDDTWVIEYYAGNTLKQDELKIKF